jgi:hypothetical protein
MSQHHATAGPRGYAIRDSVFPPRAGTGQRGNVAALECLAVSAASAAGLAVGRRVRCSMSATSRLLPFQPMSMTAAQLAAVSFLARYAGHTHELYAYQLRRWFEWCEANGLDPLVGIQRAHVELYIRGLGEAGLMASSTNTTMHGVRGYFRFAHIDGLIPADPAVYARLPNVHSDESRTQGLDRLELIRFLQIAQTITVHHGALAYLLGINALRASEAAAVRIEKLRRDAAWSPRLAPGRQGRQAADDAVDRPGPASSGSLPR